METGLDAAGDATTWRILDRHAQAEDSGAEVMSADNPLGVVRYVYTRKALPGDVADALLLVVHLRRALDRAELALLRARKRDELTWQDLAELLGLHSRQAAYQHARSLGDVLAARRLQAEIGAAGSEEKAGQSRAPSALRGGGRDTQPQTAKRWLEHNEPAIRRKAQLLASLPSSHQWWSEDAAELAETLKMAVRAKASVAELVTYLSMMGDDWRRHGMPQAPGAVSAAAVLGREWDTLRVPQGI
jgi:hypothetical protein